MTELAPCGLADVQNTADSRGIALDQVGIRDLRYPITVLDPDAGQRDVTATLAISVSLPAHFKGTHMSRFIEALNEHRGEFTVRTLPALLNDMRRRLDAPSARIEIRFPYFLERTAPVSRQTALMDYEAMFEGVTDECGMEFIVGVKVPVTTVCPCSREISDYGAHNQRGEVTIRARTRHGSDGLPEIVWLEELIAVAEGAASSPVYPLLKRADERHVTMWAYDHPAFVEDVVRDVAVRLTQDERIVWFEVAAANHESIHNHDAFAQLTWKRPDVTRTTP